jgi:hypothetical protein
MMHLLILLYKMLVELLIKYSLLELEYCILMIQNMKRGYNVSPYNPNILLNFIDSDEDILVFVDGDDWLFAESTVLNKLNTFL